MSVLEDGRNASQLAVDGDDVRVRLDANRVHDERVHGGRRRDRFYAARGGGEPERQCSRARPSPNDHDMEPGATARHTGTECGELQLALPDPDEHERRQIVVLDCIDHDHDAKERKSYEQTCAGNQ